MAPPESCAEAQSPLERLPADLRYIVLSGLRLEDLRSLVMASSVFHAQYRHSRAVILTHSLAATLGSSALADACAVYESGLPGFTSTQCPTTIKAFLVDYQERRRRPLSKALAEDKAAAIAGVYLSVVKPLTAVYVSWMLECLAGETDGPPGNQKLSRAEETRVLRAMYRFHLCAGLFGTLHYPQVEAFCYTPRPLRVARDFLPLFDAWQVEEILCVRAFALKLHQLVLGDIRWDIHPDNPKFSRGWTNSPFLDNGYIWNKMPEGCISRGLELLHTVLNIDNHQQLVSTMQSHLLLHNPTFLDPLYLIAPWQEKRRGYRPTDEDDKMRRREPMPFRGDEEETCTSGAHPPQAWTSIWEETYTSLHGYDYVPYRLRPWGYIFWDATRLEATGGKDLLMRQWFSKWHGVDPRTRLWDWDLYDDSSDTEANVDHLWDSSDTDAE